MKRGDEFIQTVDTIFSDAVNQGIFHLDAENEKITGRTIKLKGKELLNFGSCSYLGLELHPKIIQGVIDAVSRYGSQFSSSRSYVSSPQYTELEGLLSQLFNGEVIVTPSTTLGHLSAIPILVKDDDAVIMDHQVHNSVQMATNQLKLRGIVVDIIPHSRMDLLESKFMKLRQHHRNVWYFADGVYSMYGDLAPLKDIETLLNKYEQFHLYLDDAHGMSWVGKHGCGYALSEIKLHERMVLATSLNKGFAAGGGVLVFPNKELKRLVRTCGSTLIFSGPVQPPMVGAAVASAKLHLSGELERYQHMLQGKILHCTRLLQTKELPVIATSPAPIHYIGLGLPRVSYNMVRRLLNDGFYVNIAPFPGVPMKCCGVRFTINNHLKYEDINQLVEAMNYHYPEVLRIENTSIREIKHSFRKALPEILQDEYFERFYRNAVERETKQKVKPKFSIQHEVTITEIEKEEWNRLLSPQASVSWEGLKFLEETFRGYEEKENNWEFHYYIIRNLEGVPVLATFFTYAIWKDDFTADKSVSAKIEKMRVKDPYYLTSGTFAMGSLMTEGNHLYLDRTLDWQNAMLLLIKEIQRKQKRYNATTLALRDLPDNDPEFEAFIRRQGFVKTAMPDSHILNEMEWKTVEEYHQKLTYRSRYHQRKEVIGWEKAYCVEIITSESVSPSEEILKYMHELYTNVESKNLDLNVFPLPKDLFIKMAGNPCWEFILLDLKKPHRVTSDDGALPVAMAACFKTADRYYPIIVGLNYTYVIPCKAYRQILWQIIKRAHQLKMKQVFLGMTADLEKHRFGATARPQVAYVQTIDNLKAHLISNIDVDKRKN